LDRHAPKGQDIVRRLVSQCDVVLENFRPGVLERWGLGWDALHAINPRLVMARITAFGQTGPLNQGPGYAAIGSAFGGTWYVNGSADRPPARPTPVYPDYMTGLFTAFGVMAALRHRDLTGEGQWIDAALLELMTQWFSGRRFDKAVAELKASDIPHSPIMSMADIFVDPHYRARQMLIDVPAEGLGSLPQPGVVPKLSLTPGRVTHAGAALGRHTDEILSGVLGLTADEIVSLRAERVV